MGGKPQAGTTPDSIAKSLLADADKYGVPHTRDALLTFIYFPDDVPAEIGEDVEEILTELGFPNEHSDRS